MTLPSGQPWWQNGMPQSMQRAPCSRTSASGAGRYTSFQSRMRSAMGRAGTLARLISMNPATLPIGGSDPRDWLCHGVRRDSGGRSAREQHSLVLARHDLDEALARRAPLGQDTRAGGTLRVPHVAADHRPHEIDVLDPIERLEVDHLAIAAPREIAVEVEHVGDSAA